MKIQKFREMNSEDLNNKLVKLKEQLLNLRFQLALGQLKNTSQIRKIKTSIAQINTVISENILSKK